MRGDAGPISRTYVCYSADHHFTDSTPLLVSVLPSVSNMRNAEFTPNDSETLRSVTYALSTKNFFQEKIYIHEFQIVYVVTAFARPIDKLTHCSPLVAPSSRFSSVLAEALEHSRSKTLLTTICLDSDLPRTRDPLFTAILGVGLGANGENVKHD